MYPLLALSYSQQTGRREREILWCGVGTGPATATSDLVGELPVLPKHWGSTDDRPQRRLSATTLEKPLARSITASRIFAAGRSLPRLGEGFTLCPPHLTCGAGRAKQVRDECAFEFFRRQLCCASKRSGRPMPTGLEKTSASIGLRPIFPLRSPKSESSVEEFRDQNRFRPVMQFL